jgi:hypothetical protein
LAIVVDADRLGWRGRRAPTITLDDARNKEFLDETGMNGAPHITIAPAHPGLMSGASETDEFGVPVGSDERLYMLSIYRGGLDAVGFRVVVRKLEGMWVIARVDEAWIS